MKPVEEPEHFCISCKEKIDSASNPGRVLTRACYEQYGLDPQETNPQDVRICQKCRLGIIKKRHNHCPVGTCKTAKRRVKPTRPLPPKWKELTKEQRSLLAGQLQIGDESTKCCSGCHKRILRRVEAVLSGEEQAENEPPANNEEESQSAWNEQDKGRLKTELHMKPALVKVPGIESEEEDNSEDDTVLTMIEPTTSDSPKQESKEDPPQHQPPIMDVKEEPPLAETEDSEDTAAEATSLHLSRLVASLDRDLSRSQDSVKSSGESNATLSADEGHSENEASLPKEPPVLETKDAFLGKKSTERAALEKRREAGALLPGSLPQVGTPTPAPTSQAPLYKPKFKFLESETPAAPAAVPPETEKKGSVMKDIIESSITRNVLEEGLGGRHHKVSPPHTAPPVVTLPEKSDSPDIQIIGQKQPSSLTLQPRKGLGGKGPGPGSPSPLRPPQGPQKSPVSRHPQGSITAGTPVRQPLPTIRHTVHYPLEGLLRPATPFPLSREDPSRPSSTEMSRISPLVFSPGGMGEGHHSFLHQAAGAHQAQNQALLSAQTQYRHALSLGYTEHQALLLYQQAYAHVMQHRMPLQPQSTRQILDDFRTSLQMPHLGVLGEGGGGGGGGAGEQALLQQHLYGHHIREEQRRAVESQQRLAQERERLAQEQQRAIRLAQAAEHQQRAALLGRHLAMAQAASDQYKDHLATAAVAEHHQRALALAQSDAQRRAMAGYIPPGSAPPPGLKPSEVKSEPKSPVISSALQFQQTIAKHSIGTGHSDGDERGGRPRSVQNFQEEEKPSGSQGPSVIQETKPEVKKRSETPIMSKGAMKEFPPSLQHQQHHKPTLFQPKLESPKGLFTYYTTSR